MNGVKWYQFSLIIASIVGKISLPEARCVEVRIMFMVTARFVANGFQFTGY